MSRLHYLAPVSILVVLWLCTRPVTPDPWCTADAGPQGRFR